MESKLNKTLDELAAESKKQRKRNINKRLHSKRLQYQRRRQSNTRQTHQRGRIQNKNKSQNKDLRRRLLITNLDKTYTNEQLRKLFEQYGKLTRCGIHFSKLGESLGSADIQFEKHEEAENAISKINNTNVGNLVINVKYSNSGKSNLGNKRINIIKGRRRNVKNNGNNKGRNNKRNNIRNTGVRRKGKRNFRSLGKKRRN
jgi:RNA recognition motif-containing protein